jgi:DNA-binding NarL/FixJ family response regulator
MELKSPMSSDAPFSPHPQPTRVLCVDDSTDMAELLVVLIRREPDLEAVGILNCADGVVEEVIRSGVDVVVLDLTMPGAPPLQTIRDLAERVPSCRVIAFSGYDDLDTRLAAQRAGAWELVAKNGGPLDIIHAIRRVARAVADRDERGAAVAPSVPSEPPIQCAP